MTASRDSSATERWQRLVAGRIGETNRIKPDIGSLSGSFWDTRAERYARNVRLADIDRDPFLRRLRRLTDASSSAIDVGAGTGRYALALARSVAHVTAVEPSAAMLAILRRGAEQHGLANVTAVQATWADADVAQADVAFSSFVMTLVPDARAFVEKLDSAARRHVLLYLGGYAADAVVDPLWRHFHDVPRAPGPSYVDAIAVLRELGIEPDVELVEIPNVRRFATLDDAVEQYRDWLLLEDTAQVRDELRELLSVWLFGRRGALRSPLRSVPAAVIRWRPRAGA